MARKALRECNKAGCHELTRERYCSKHKAEYDRADSQRHKEYDRTKRDKTAAEFYKSKEWQRARAEALARSLYLCQDCLARGVIKRPRWFIISSLLESIRVLLWIRII